MEYREFTPSDPVRSFVERYWTLEIDGGAAGVQRVVPDGRAELILNLGQPFEACRNGHWNRQPGCFLAGQLTGPLMLRPSERAKMIGVRFSPHGTPRLFGQPMQELADSIAPVAELSPALARDLSRVDAVSTLDALLARRAAAGRQDLLVREAVRRMVDARGATDIAGLARFLNVSTRQLERRFQNGVGLSPKLFCRMQRFQQVFQVIDAGGTDWVQAALECGYYDQAHLIRDFKEFSGETPAALLADDALARHFLSHFPIQRSGLPAKLGGMRPLALLTLTTTLLLCQSGPGAAVIANLAGAKWTHDAGDPPGSESVTLREDAQTGALELLVRYPAGHVFSPHWHTANERMILLEGRMSLRRGEKDEFLDVGGYAFLPAKEVQRMACVSKTRCTFYVYWDGKLDFHPAK